jgi:hypothetical protein
MEIAARGHPAHTRVLTVEVDQHAQGVLEARGHILDIRKRGLVPMAGQLQTAGVVHDMKVDALVDPSGPSIQQMTGRQDSVAFEPTPATGGECCRDPMRRIEALAGAPLDAGIPRRLSDAIGSIRGCSHVLTLAQLACSTLGTAIAKDRQRHGAPPERRAGEHVYDRSLSIDAIAGEGTLHCALQLADVHFEPAFEDAHAMELLASHQEVRIHAEIELASMQIRALRAVERHNVPEAGGAWRDRSDALTPLVGRPALGGLAGQLFELLGEHEADRPLLDSLLNLSPLLIQTTPAIMDRWQVMAQRTERERISGPPGGACYMTRTDGPMILNHMKWADEVQGD